MSSKFYVLKNDRIAVDFSDSFREEPEVSAVLHAAHPELKQLRTPAGALRWMNLVSVSYREQLLAAAARDDANRAPAAAPVAPAPKPATPAPVARQYMSRADREEAREERELAEMADYADNHDAIDAANRAAPESDAARAYRVEVRAHTAARERELAAQRADTIARFARSAK
jgi:hypothetical protein